MNFYCGEKPTGEKTREGRRCTRCDAQPGLVLQILNPRSGGTVRMFECKCGQRTWSD
jgi:hypothetical protein